MLSLSFVQKHLIAPSPVVIGALLDGKTSGGFRLVSLEIYHNHNLLASFVFASQNQSLYIEREMRLHGQSVRENCKQSVTWQDRAIVFFIVILPCWQNITYTVVVFRNVRSVTAGALFFFVPR